MVVGTNRNGAVSASRIDGHRLSEFIYGTVTGMVAVAGIDANPQLSWLSAASIIVVGAAAIWGAHAYSILLGRLVAEGRRLKARELLTVLEGSWPIVTAGAVLAAPLLLTAVGLVSLDAALRACSALGVLVLGVVGYLAGVATRETWPRRLVLGGLSAALGLGVVAVEFVVHR